jgi:hypothetical protein
MSTRQQPTGVELRSTGLPPGPLRLSPCEIVIDPRRFIETQFALIAAQLDQKAAKPANAEGFERNKFACYDRLLRLLDYLVEVYPFEGAVEVVVPPAPIGNQAPASAKQTDAERREYATWVTKKAKESTKRRK